MTRYTMKDDYGSLYLDEFLVVNKESINDQMVIDARMEAESLLEMLASGFEIVKIKIIEVN